MRKISYCLVVVIVGFLSSCGPLRDDAAKTKPAPFYEEVTVWEHKEDNLWPYHCYGLAQTAKGTLLACAEGRVGMSDHSPHSLVVKRSEDGGRTWSENIFIEKADGSFWSANGKPGKMEAWATPTLIADTNTGRVFFFYSINSGSKNMDWSRVFYCYSDDDGKTWLPKGKRIEITDMLDDNRHGWTCHGPSYHGIQLQRQRGKNADKNGRLIVPVYHRRAINANPRRYGVSMLVSDDHGKNWRHTGDAGIGYGMNENRLVELEDGRLLLNARGGAAVLDGKKNNTQKYRVYASSIDAGETFGGHEVRKEFVYSKNGCDSGMKQYSTKADDGKSILLFSRPADPDKRAKMTMSVSYDEGESWTYHKLIHDGGSFYSTIAVLPDKTIGLLYGKGSRKEHGQLPGHVVLARFNMEWLMQR